MRIKDLRISRGRGVSANAPDSYRQSDLWTLPACLPACLLASVFSQLFLSIVYYVYGYECECVASRASDRECQCLWLACNEMKSFRSLIWLFIIIFPYDAI